MQFSFVVEEEQTVMSAFKIPMWGWKKKHLCIPPKYTEASRSGNPLKAQPEQTNHWDIIIKLPGACIYRGIFPCGAGHGSGWLPAMGVAVDRG